MLQSLTRHRVSAFPAQAAFIFAVWSAGSARAATTYTFTTLARTGDVINGQAIRDLSPAAMNNNGTVVFTGNVNCGPAGCTTVIYQASPGSTPLPVATRGATIAGETLAGAYNPSIDDSGTILFTCILGTGAFGACTPSAILLKEGDTLGGNIIPRIGDNWISGNGAIVFKGQSIRPSPDIGLVLEADGLFTLSAFLLKTCESSFSGATLITPCDPKGASGDTVGGKTLFGIAFPVINNSGSIVFFGASEVGNSAIFSLSSLLVSTGATIGGHTLTSVGPPRMNNAGTVVFGGSYSGVNGVAGIFTPSAALIQTGDTIAGHVLDVILGPAGINDSGTILFKSHFQAQPGVPQGWGIFTNSGFVIKEGDMIGGKTTALINGAWINNSGSILLGIQFTDNTQAVVLAQPVTITPVAIAIEGGQSPAVINSKSNGKILVAILSNPDFNAPTSLDRTSVTFGQTGDEPSLASCTRGGTDVNGDGRPDVLCQFNTQLTGFRQGDAIAVLKGKTTRGTPLSGSAAIRVVP